MKKDKQSSFQIEWCPEGTIECDKECKQKEYKANKWMAKEISRVQRYRVKRERDVPKDAVRCDGRVNGWGTK